MLCSTSQTQIYTHTHTELKCSLAECGVVMRGLAEASQRFWLNLVPSWSANPPLNVSAALSSDSSLWTLRCNKSYGVLPFHPVRHRHHSQFNTHWWRYCCKAGACVCAWARVRGFGGSLHIISLPHPLPASLMSPFSAPDLQLFSVLHSFTTNGK